MSVYFDIFMGNILPINCKWSLWSRHIKTLNTQGLEKNTLKLYKDARYYNHKSEQTD